MFGATGNVGSYVLLYALSYFDKGEYQIIASGRRKTNFFCRYNIDYINVDLSKPEDFDRLPSEDVYAVIDLAAVIPSYMSVYNPMSYIESNFIGSVNVLEYCRKVGADRVLFSTTAYDIWNSNKPGVVIKPDAPVNFSYKGDHAVYVISKNASIEMIKHYYEEYGLKYFVFRFPTIYHYSPYPFYFPNGIKTKRPIYSMIEKAIRGDSIELWGNPDYSKDMVYVDDCAQMICLAVECELDNGFFNVGTGMPVTLYEQINAIIEVFSPKDKKSRIIYCPEKPCGGGVLMDVSNARNQLGYSPQYDVNSLFMAFKEEMKVNRFAELRMRDE